jgi:hypothetical protein
MEEKNGSTILIKRAFGQGRNQRIVPALLLS